METLEVRPSWTKAQKVFSSLASRPPLHPFLEQLACWMVPPASLKRLDELGDWIHFVGTGWDFFGFALLRWARQQGKPFTIWPAVHPRDWGDDVVDIRLYSRADHIFCQSKHEMTHLGALGVPYDKLVFCGLPPMCLMDGDSRRFREAHSLTPEAPTVLFLGRRDEGKGYPALLKAWPLVLKECPQAVLLLAGPGGSEYQMLKEVVPSTSLCDLGVPDEVAKADALAACDIFCLPSSHEAFGIAYVEAWAYAKPVICGLAPACRQLVEEGVTGLWADQDPPSLAGKIVSLLQQPELRERLGQAGRARQQRDFTSESVARIHVEALDRTPETQGVSSAKQTVPGRGNSHMTISAIILTYNEGARLRDCLASATWCDEIIVVDGYSTDNTVEVAKEFTDKVFLSDRLGPTKPGGFADQRNYGLDQSSCDWVFFLDADEHFTPELGKEVRRRLREGIPPEVTVFRVRRREHYFGVYTPYTHGEAWQTRMHRKVGVRWDARLVHEGILTEGKTDSLDGYLLHFSKDSIKDYLTTQNRYTSLEAEQAVADGEPMPKSPFPGIIRTFLNLYVYKGSYREGAFGLIMSLFFAQYNFLCWAKRWEIEMKAGRIKPNQPRLVRIERLAALLRFIWHKKSPPQP